MRLSLAVLGFIAHALTPPSSSEMQLFQEGRVSVNFGRVGLVLVPEKNPFEARNLMKPHFKGKAHCMRYNTTYSLCFQASLPNPVTSPSLEIAQNLVFQAVEFCLADPAFLRSGSPGFLHTKKLLSVTVAKKTAICEVGRRLRIRFTEFRPGFCVQQAVAPFGCSWDKFMKEKSTEGKPRVINATYSIGEVKEESDFSANRRYSGIAISKTIFVGNKYIFYAGKDDIGVPIYGKYREPVVHEKPDGEPENAIAVHRPPGVILHKELCADPAVGQQISEAAYQAITRHEYLISRSEELVFSVVESEGKVTAYMQGFKDDIVKADKKALKENFAKCEATLSAMGCVHGKDAALKMYLKRFR